VERYARTRRLPWHEVSDEEILGKFEDAAAVDGLNWRDSLWQVGRRYGLIDVGGEPASKSAARVIAKARKAYRRWRRDFLEDKMASALSESGTGNQAPLLELYRKLGKAKAEALQTRIEAQWNAARATLARAAESEAPTGKNCVE
jgi:hypothetical protein